jgi:hypothetical protein
MSIREHTSYVIHTSIRERMHLDLVLDPEPILLERCHKPRLSAQAEVMHVSS